jgi:hypothetical protein
MNAEQVSARNVETVRKFYQSERDRDVEVWRRFWHAEGRQTFPTLGADASVSGIDALSEVTREKFVTRPPYGIDDRVEAFSDPSRVFASLDLSFPGAPVVTIWCIFTFDEEGLIVEVEEIFDRGDGLMTGGAE